MQNASALTLGFVGVLIVSSLASQGTEKAADEKPPAEGSITANLNGDRWSVLFDSTEYLKVAMDGDPEQKKTQLVDASGLAVATVEPVEDDHCDDLPRRSTGLGTDEWCLRVSGLDAGREVSGEVPGDSVLTLKVTERYHFLGAPLFVAGLGFLLSLVWTFATTRGLPEWIPNSRLKRVLRGNRNATDNRIEDLDAWSEALKSKGAGTILQAVEEIRTTGIPKAQRSRKALKEATVGSSLPPNNGILASAREEASRSTHKISDFYKDDGTAVDEHPAVAQATLLDRAQKLFGRLGSALLDIDSPRVPSGMRGDLQTKAAEVKETLDHAGNADALEQATAKIVLLEQAVFAAMRAVGDEPRTLQLISAIQEASLEEFVAAEASDTAPQPIVPGLDIDTSAWRLRDVVDAALASRSILALLAVIQAIIALYTVAVAVYWPNQTFGATPDWFALFAAAFASSSAAAIVGLAAIGEIKKPAA